MAFLRTLFPQIVVLFLAACSTGGQLTQEQSAYQELCLANGHGWMLMSELKDGSVVGPSCHGCMPDDNNHICNRNDYEEYLRRSNHE